MGHWSQLVTEEQIIAKETDYLEATPSGNIVLGFDNYVKGANAAAAQRRKTGLPDQNRVFSRSSVSYNPNAAVRFLDPPYISYTPASPLRFDLVRFAISWVHPELTDLTHYPSGCANTRLDPSADAHVEHLWREQQGRHVGRAHPQQHGWRRRRRQGGAVQEGQEGHGGCRG